MPSRIKLALIGFTKTCMSSEHHVASTVRCVAELFFSETWRQLCPAPARTRSDWFGTNDPPTGQVGVSDP